MAVIAVAAERKAAAMVFFMVDIILIFVVVR